jgi:hypothetical protein
VANIRKTPAKNKTQRKKKFAQSEIEADASAAQAMTNSSRVFRVDDYDFFSPTSEELTKKKS